ncbi:hypothetical protein GGS20DRAFT_226675 [Poronia punctata]|nr:hypothetical protein GGS20DRAFT_226675 [Poronia punctata]
MRSLFLSEEELGKKDDDHKTVKSTGRRRLSWQPARVPPRRSLKRIGVLLVVAAFVYIFVHNIPILGPNDRMRRPTYLPPGTRQPPPAPDFPSGGMMHPPDPIAQPAGKTNAQVPMVNTAERGFDGPLRFLSLASSLQAIANTRGGQPLNRNVVFAAASLKSASTLLPTACQMGAAMQNYVHFVLLGRSTIDIESLREINGVAQSCAIVFHDARPDSAAISTDRRLENSVFRGFHHINQYIHPQAILVDGSNDEEAFLTRGVTRHVKLSKTSLIELPGKASKDIDWIAKVDSQALRMWDKTQIDILIQATPGSFGSLKRLLRSLAAADYTSSTIPHITIELPHHIDVSTKAFLQSFAWPPAHVHNPTNARRISLRHRVSSRRLTEEESVVRFLESFWPAQPQQSHVLVLSPHAEVAPHFFHYLNYVLLEYRYSSSAEMHHWDRRLFGISLEQPSLTLEGNPFLPPLFQHPEDVDGREGGTPNPFLWQAPASNAVLFLGGKWMELHDFVSRSMQAKENLDITPAILSEKVIGKQHPSWMEHALRLARARGYWFLYPGEEVAEHLATVHVESYTVPEEYSGKHVSNGSPSDGASDIAVGDVKEQVRSGAELPLSPLSVLESLPNDGKLWPLSALPIAAWDGAEVTFQDLRTRAGDFELAFKRDVGACKVESKIGQKPLEPMLAQDLFCNVP